MKRHLVWWGAGILVAVAAIAWWMLRCGNTGGVCRQQRQN
ncbi:HlyD family secretion protein [Salmonella enterica subsp. enterica serovar Saintpaul str. S-70]|nr:HlyD family secretion protein [Salmonella enterica subsp. enterica serovar Saintpaul str. S-70]